MTEAWTHPQHLLERMPDKGRGRKFRLFAVACYRVCLKRYDAYQHHLDMAERYADGEASEKEMLALPAVPADRDGGLLVITSPNFRGFDAAWEAAGLVMGCPPHHCRIPGKQDRCDAMCSLLLDIFGSVPEVGDVADAAEG